MNSVLGRLRFDLRFGASACVRVFGQAASYAGRSIAREPAGPPLDDDPRTQPVG